MSTATATKSEFGLVPIQEIPIDKLTPSPENDRLYKPIDPADPDFIALADSIAEISVQEPLIVIRSGELPAINIATDRDGKRPRYLIDQRDIEAFENSRAVVPPAPRQKRRRRRDPAIKEYF